MRLKLRIKVLIPVVLMILTLIIVSLLVTNQVVRKQVMQSVSRNLREAAKIFSELQKKEWALLAERSAVIAETPHLKAAVDTGDSTTVQNVVDRIFSTLGSDVLVVVGQTNNVLAKNSVVSVDFNSINSKFIFTDDVHPKQGDGIFKIGKDYFHVQSVPILINDDLSGKFVLGKVIIGKVIDEGYLKKLRELINCEIAFRDSGQVIISTLKDFSTTVENKFSSNKNKVVNLEFNGEEFLALESGQMEQFFIFKSVDKAFNQMILPIEKTMVFVGFFGFFAAILISIFISYGIVAPIEKLVNAAKKITEGDYEHEIRPDSNDEIGLLSAKFEEMRQTIRQKISQINERNETLELTLSKLETTQNELVRTERLAATGKITAQLSHELNNPIHNIQSCLETAKKKISKNGNALEFIDLAHDEIVRIGTLTRQMLDFYRPSAVKKTSVNINFLVEDVLKAFERNLKNDKIKVSLNSTSEIADVIASGDQLRQVVWNLMNNATEAMPEGGDLNIQTFESEDLVCIKFKDTGGGIAPGDIDKIYDAFFTTKAQANGVGLGLSVTYGIIKDHKGVINVESELEKGTTFTIQLPKAENV